MVALPRHKVGVAAGVPYLAKSPASTPTPTTPIVVAWHLMDPPCTESAFASALPLAGVDAWRIYLGLPLCGSRTPAGGAEELTRLGMADAVLELFDPVISQAAAEFAPAFDELRGVLGFGDGAIGFLGGSAGACVAQTVLAESTIPVSAAVLVSPLIALRKGIEAGERRFGFAYPWSDAARKVSDRFDFVARALEMTRGRGELPVLSIVGADDDEGFRAAAKAQHNTLAAAYADPDRTRYEKVAGMGHNLAEPPGTEPAPQTRSAATVDRLASEWFRKYLQ